MQYDILQCLTVLGPSTSAVRSSSLITRSGSQPGRYSRPLVGGREPGDLARVKELELEYPYRPYRLACRGLVEVRTTCCGAAALILGLAWPGRPSNQVFSSNLCHTPHHTTPTTQQLNTPSNPTRTTQRRSSHPLEYPISVFHCLSGSRTGTVGVRSMAQPIGYDYISKIVSLGDSGSGKSSVCMPARPSVTSSSCLSTSLIPLADDSPL